MVSHRETPVRWVAVDVVRVFVHMEVIIADDSQDRSIDQRALESSPRLN